MHDVSEQEVLTVKRVCLSLFVATVLCFSTSIFAGGGPVVVFGDAGFPYYNANPMVEPKGVADRLRGLGINARVESCKEILADGLAGVSVFVNIYGNTYAKALEPVLLAFKRRGGSIVSTGIPFCHPCRRTERGWVDEGHTMAFAYRLGFGDFAGPLPGGLKIKRGKLAGLCGLDRIVWASIPTDSTQYLDVAKLPGGTKVEPVLLLHGPKGKDCPVSAILLRDSCPDAWALTPVFAGTTCPFSPELTTEIVARVVALVLHERHEINLVARPLPPPPASIRRFQKPVAKLAQPAESLYPHAARIASTLYVFSTAGLDFPERLLATTVQGLANRDVARVWLNQKAIDPFWLEWIVKRGDTQKTVELKSLKDLLHRFPPPGAVVYDPDYPHTINIATMIAAVRGAAVTTAEVARRYDLRVLEDLRGRFQSNAAAYAWAFEKLWPQLTHRVIACTLPSRHPGFLNDYLVAQKVFCFWISGPKDGQEKGASMADELAVMTRILQQMPTNIPILGYPYAGTGIGIQEGPGVTLFSRTGKFLVPSDHQPNLSVLTATRRPTALHQLPPRKLSLDPSRIYATLTMSDGDNLNTYYDYFINYWRSPQHGKFPVGWTMGPSAYDFFPAVVDWYYQHQTPMDLFQSAVSGIGYTYPDHYGSDFLNRGDVLNQFLDLTDQYMRKLDQRTMWVMGVHDAMLKLYAEKVSVAHALFPDYGRRHDIHLGNADYFLAGKPVFHALVSCNPGGLRRELENVVGATRPAFVNIFLLNWSWKMPAIERAVESLPDDVVLVRPDELAELYRAWEKKKKTDEP